MKWKQRLQAFLRVCNKRMLSTLQLQDMHDVQENVGQSKLFAVRFFALHYLKKERVNSTKERVLLS